MAKPSQRRSLFPKRDDWLSQNIPAKSKIPQLFWQKARVEPVEDSLLWRCLLLLSLALSLLTIDIATSVHFSPFCIALATISSIGCWYARHQQKHPAVIAITLVWLLLLTWAFQFAAYQASAAREATGFLAVLGMGILTIVPLGWRTRQNLGFATLLSWGTAAIVSTSNTNPATICCTVLISLLTLPILWLDYRSRLGLPPLPWNWQTQQLKKIPWRYLAQVGTGTILVSLVLAMALGAMPQLKFPDLSALTKKAVTTAITDHVDPVTTASTSAQPPPAGKFTPELGQATPGSNPTDMPMGTHSEVFAPAIAAKYQQLTPQQQAQLQAHTQAIIQYQQGLVGQPVNNSPTAQAQDLATFVQTHAQPGQTTADSLTEFLKNCANPQTCQIPGSSAQQAETYGLMARSVNIPPQIAAAQVFSPSASFSPANRLYPTPAPQTTSSQPHSFDGSRVIIVIFIATAIGCISLIWWYEQKMRRYRRRFAALPPLEQIYRQMLKQLQKRGLKTRRTTQSPEEYAAIVHPHLSSTSARLVTRISQTYSAWRYGHKAANIDLMHQLLQELIAEPQPQKK